MNDNLELTTSIIKTIIRENGLEDFSIAFHNACVHGTVFDGNISNKALDRLFDILDELIALSKEEGI